MKLPKSAFFAAVLVASAAAQDISDRYVSPGFEHRVFFNPGDPELARLDAGGAVVRREDYGAFFMAVVDERQVGGRNAFLGIGLDVRDDQAVVGFNGAPLDTADADGLKTRLDAIPAILRAGDSQGGASLWIIQFAGPIRDAWLTKLAATGATIVSPMATNAYVVALDAVSAAPFAGLRGDPAVQWIGAYQPFFKLAPELRVLDFRDTRPIDLMVQLVAGDGATRLLGELPQAGVRILNEGDRVLGYLNVKLQVPPSLIPALAADAAVFGIDRRSIWRRHDEAQNQIVAGNMNAIQSGPSAPGYLAWLASKGFAQAGQFAFAIDMSDTGIDRGSTSDVNDEFKVLGPGGASRITYFFNYTVDTLADCGDGHGNLGASVAGGYNAMTGSAWEDAGGYNYGLGVCPFVQLGGTKVFNNAGNPDFLQSEVVRLGAAYGAGARVNNNAWGATGGNTYTAECQSHDVLVRDATSMTAGNQELTVVFSAGNDGNAANSVHPPATSKNVIVVGAGENNRQTGTDGCGFLNLNANNALDITNFSSRGPCSDLRKKPDIMAPGTHIQGAVSRSLNYNASGICNFAWPLGQTIYTWGSGTSFSAPAVSGGCALIRQDFINHGLAVPSPAMIKALLMSSTRYMTGVSANDTLWSNVQGMGLVDLGRVFDGTPRILVDQTRVFGASGQTHVVNGTIASSATPFRVGLVWTDAPGPTTGNAWVNNLDLQVTVNGTSYRGNVFTGASSTTGGAADTRNNAEFVFLPAGATGTFSVTVTATNIAGDGVPGNADTSDQDFALVVYNANGCSPVISSVSPPQITPPLGSSTTITVTGSCFVPSSVVHANCIALPTTYVNPTTLTCTLGTSIPQTQIRGAICMNVQNNVDEVSNSVALRVGSGNNAGTIRRQPLVPTPGGYYSILIEGGVPYAAFTLVGDLGTVTPVGGFPDATTNFVLAASPIAGSAGPLITVFDGLGVFGPPTGFVFDANGRFIIPSIYYPSPALGITATLQAVYADPSSPIGLRLTWARFPEQI